MAETHEYSDLITNWRTGRLNNGAQDSKDKEFHFTQGAAPGDANSTASLFLLKANEILYVEQFMLQNTAFGAGRTLNIGHRGYEEVGGRNQVAPNFTAVATGHDVAAAGTQRLSNVTAPGVVSVGPYPRDVEIVAQVQGGTIPAGAELHGSASVGMP